MPSKSRSYIRPCFEEGDITFNQVKCLAEWLDVSHAREIFIVAIAEFYAKERVRNTKKYISPTIPRFPHERSL